LYVGRRFESYIAAALFEQYLQIAFTFRKLPDPEDRLLDRVQLFGLSVSALLHSQPTTEGWTVGEELAQRGTLETIFDDLQAIWNDRQLIIRFEKQEAKRAEKGDKNYLLKRAYAGLFGWNDRGLVAAKLFPNIGFPLFESASVASF
jgi:hypothetical protein